MKYSHICCIDMDPPNLRNLSTPTPRQFHTSLHQADFRLSKGPRFLWEEVGISEQEPQVGTPPRKKGIEFKGLPSREWKHIPPNGKFGKSSSQRCHFGGDMWSFPGGLLLLTLKGFLTTRPLIKPKPLISRGVFTWALEGSREAPHVSGSRL